MKKTVFFYTMIFFVLAFPAFAEKTVYVRFMPLINLPAGIDYFDPGFGGKAFLDYRFIDLPLKLGLGLSLGAGYSQLTVEDKSAFSIFDADLGPFIDLQMRDRFSLRGGLGAGVYHYQWNQRKNLRPKANFSFAALFHINPFLSVFGEASYNLHAFADALPINNFRAGFGISINLGELIEPLPRVSAEKTGQSRILPVLYTWYENNEIAKIQVSNNEPNTIDNVELSLYLERYMNQPTRFASIPHLGPGEAVEIPVTALFNESLLELVENINALGLLSVAYQSLGMNKAASFSMSLPIYHRNAFTWDDDRRAASFVSAGDPGAVYFSRYVEASVRNTVNQEKALPKNMLFAAALFEALALYGINYLVDPSSSYIELSENAASLDNLNYPYQTLMYRGGDCDDLSILFCSLLEAQGIRSAFITIPNHIYAAFDIGTAAGNTGNLIYADGVYWLPVEITAVDKGFAEAWRMGIRQWKESADDRALYPMEESWTLYRPVSVPGAAENLPVMPLETEILQRYKMLLANLNEVYHVEK
jgi:hypothetical protein